MTRRRGHDAERFETLVVHAAAEPDRETGAVAPPIHPSTTFVRDPGGATRGPYVYARTDNPTRARLEEALTQVQPGAAAAATFASGSAAASALFRAFPVGSTVVVPDRLYHGVAGLLRGMVDKGQLDVVAVDMSDLTAVREAVRRNASLVWIETPSNPTLTLTDVASVADAAHAVGAYVAVDATWTPPSVQDPFAAGADLVVHSSTKFFAGHSDVLGGVVLARDPDTEPFTSVRFWQRSEGAVPSPFDAWLTLRGLRTLALRVRAACDGAEQVAAALADHPAVLEVFYPGLAAHPQHALARSSMHRFGSMVSFRVHGGAAAADRVASRTRWFVRATSLGGVESLIEHRAPVEGAGTTTPPDLLRLSIGIEHPADLIDDLAAALEPERP